VRVRRSDAGIRFSPKIRRRVDSIRCCRYRLSLDKAKSHLDSLPQSVHTQLDQVITSFAPPPPRYSTSQVTPTTFVVLVQTRRTNTRDYRLISKGIM
jgi:hypothetical protein